MGVRLARVAWCALNDAHLPATMRGFDLNGECAGVSHHDDWQDQVTGAPLWSQKIKVYPWVVFSVVTLRIQPVVNVDHVWAAEVLSNEVHGDQRVITVELGHKSQDDFTFSMDGTGGPIRHTTFSCNTARSATSDCGLQPQLSILNNYNGVISPKIYLETWQIGAMVDLTFQSTLTIGQTWGAEFVGALDEEDPENSPTSGYAVRFRLLPISRGLPPERKSSFGFEASPPFHVMPTITCSLRQKLPPPPPPSPPNPSPPPPERKLLDENECFLGGRMAFLKPPSVAGVPWRVDVTLVKWQPDVLLTLNFVGDTHSLEQHPLQIESTAPSEAIWQDAATKHSVTYRLRPMESDPGSLQIVAYGMITGLGQVTCCCAPPPPPPPRSPPPPTPRMPALPHPQPPAPPPFSHMINTQIAGDQMMTPTAAGPIADQASVKGSASDVTQSVWMIVLALLLFGMYGRRAISRLQAYLRSVKIGRDIRKRFGPKGFGIAATEDCGDEATYSFAKDNDSAGPAVTGSNGDLQGRRGSDAAHLEVGWRGHSSGTVDTRSGDGDGSCRLQLCLPGGGCEEALLDLKDAETMRDVQQLVLNEWAQAGGDRGESLVMEYIGQSGQRVKVSKTTTLGDLKASNSCYLTPKRCYVAPSRAAGLRPADRTMD